MYKRQKQLRIPYSDFELKEQSYSLINFKSAQMKFSNDFELLKSEVAHVFPREIDAFQKFTLFVSDYDEVSLTAKYIPARNVLDEYFKDELLKEMLIAPLLIYGSAWENDMDFSQFVIMFKSLYFEGFSRPVGGVRTILDILLDKFKALGGELRFRSEVESIKDLGERKVITLTKNKGQLSTPLILSSAGIVETQKLFSDKEWEKPSRVGRLSFLESIMLVEDKKSIHDTNATIVFHNETDKYLYQRPDGASDFSSAVVCMPDNYDKTDTEGYGTIRVTHMANFNRWNDFEKEDYLAHKNHVYNEALSLSNKLLKSEQKVVFKDIFSPRTIKKYTGHFGGTVYGSPDKVKNGSIGMDGVYIIGTDQGFLGIVGSMLSGISMANLYGLMEQR